MDIYLVKYVIIKNFKKNDSLFLVYEDSFLENSVKLRMYSDNHFGKKIILKLFNM